MITMMMSLLMIMSVDDDAAGHDDDDDDRDDNSPGLGPEGVRSLACGKVHLFSTLSVSTLALVCNSQQSPPIQSAVFATSRQSRQFSTPVLSPVHFFLHKSRTVLQLLLEQLFLVCTVRTRGCLSGSLLALE